MRIQVTFDTADPNAHDAFWAALLGYEVEDNSAFVDRPVEEGRMPPAERITVDGRSAFRDVAACVDPAGGGAEAAGTRGQGGQEQGAPRHPGGGGEEEKLAEVERAVSLGATPLGRRTTAVHTRTRCGTRRATSIACTDDRGVQCARRLNHDRRKE
ncbi:VOC family protein [Lacisediminihabitans sp.]|uniref:VOC family protein n=1 Tax=Lacisediminihabitans sp. TaxID=2787631 RepID=UPI002F959AFD